MILRITLIVLSYSIIIFATEEFDKLPKSLQKEVNKVFKSDILLLNQIDTYQIQDTIQYFLIYKILDNKNLLGYSYLSRVNSCRSEGCSFNIIQEKKSFEYFDYFVILDTSLNIKKVNVNNYQATHGQEICSKSWLKQFISKNSESTIKYGKNIDAISGATVSANNMVIDIKNKLRLLKKKL